MSVVSGIKGAGSFALLLAVLIAAMALLVLFITFGAKAGIVAMPYLTLAAYCALLVMAGILFPMTWFKRTRGRGAVWMLYASSIVGVAAWVYGFLAAYLYAGMFWLVIGLIMGVVGVVPVGFLGAAFSGEWAVVGNLTMFLLLTFAPRAFALAMLHRSEFS